jgi:hypothetical protein
MTTVVVANTAEAFLSLLERYEDPPRRRLIEAEHRLGDRAAFWGGADKIVVTSYPATHAAYAEQLGYSALVNVWPENPTPRLSLDMLHDRVLNTRLRELAPPGTKVLLSPYTVSDELLHLVAEWSAGGVQVSSPEIPAANGIAIGRRFDTKSGFREMCVDWAIECDAIRLPPGVICPSKAVAAAAASAFLSSGRTVICKADRGEAGIGLHWVREADRDAIEARLNQDAAFGSDPIVVEEVVAERGTPGFSSPSVEVCVLPSGETAVTYSCMQRFDGHGSFEGVVIGREVMRGRLVREIERAALFVGSRLRQRGYVGYFDLDFVLDAGGVPYMVEANVRKTGGTHAHDAATFLIGRDYAARVTVLSLDHVRCAPSLSFECLLTTASPWLFPIRQERRGVVLTCVGTLDAGTLGYLVIGSSLPDALAIEAAFQGSLGPAERRQRGEASDE